jgi:hypothetical protein
VRYARVAAICVLAGAAVLLALFAHDLRAWPSALAEGDIRAQAGRATDWKPSTILPAGWSEGALGLGPDRALRLAIRRFDATYATPPGFDSGLSAVEARDEAEAMLAGSAGDSNGRRASQALDLLGLLLFGDSSAGSGTAAAIRAVDDLDQAVSLDGANEQAKANLELVLRLLETHGTRIGPNAGAGPNATGHRGAGTGVPGEGY